MYHIVFQSDVGEPAAVCGFCKTAQDLQYADYVTKPMIWCDECGARIVLDIPLNYDFDLTEKNLPEVARSEVTIDKYHIGWTIRLGKYVSDPNTKFYKANALFIKRVLDRNLDDYQATRILTQEQIAEALLAVVRNYPDKRPIDQSTLDRLGIIKRGDDINIETMKSSDMDLSVECNSYDAMQPAKPYPTGMHLEHDGINVWLEVDTPRGIEYETYWGD